MLEAFQGLGLLAGMRLFDACSDLFLDTQICLY